MSIISNYLYGWNHLEPVLIGTLSQGMNVLMLGSHGCGKSLFSKFVSLAVGENKDNFKFIKYSMDKENLLSMVGCPNPESMKQGRITYATHERSIFNADVVMLDELTRASKENQNMVLEMLEERTIFGMPLKYQFAIATANEDTYRGAYKLDAALLDRFVVVLPVPSVESRENLLGAEEIREMIKLNQGFRESHIDDTNKSLVDTMTKVRQTYKELWFNDKIRENVNDFAAKFFSSLLVNMREHNKSGVSKDGQIKISFRQISNHFVPLTFAISSYYKAIKDDIDYLQNGAWEAIKYSISTKLGFPADKLRPHFDQLKDLLIDGDSLLTKVSIAVTTGSLQSRVTAFEKYASVIKEQFEYADKTNIIGGMLAEVREDNNEDTIEIIKLSDILEQDKINEQGEYMIKLRLFNSALKAGVLKQAASFF